MSRISLDQISTTVRGAITAPPGSMLVVSDLSSIESRLAGALTGCLAINNIFAEGRDVYKDLATKIYHIQYEEVTKEQRTFAKPAALGAQYMLGGRGLVKYAEGYGVELSPDEAKYQIEVYREAYPDIPTCWYWLKDAIFDVVKGILPEVTGYGLRIAMGKEFMTIQLPSGRKLYYYEPKIIWGEAPWTDINGDTTQIEKFSYMGKDAFSFQWRRITAHAGGVFENIIQAVARDVLAIWMTRADRDGFNLVGHCHDEIIGLEKEDNADQWLDYINHLATVPIDWAPGLLLTAEGYVAKRYRKD